MRRGFYSKINLARVSAKSGRGLHFFSNSPTRAKESKEKDCNDFKSKFLSLINGKGHGV